MTDKKQTEELVTLNVVRPDVIPIPSFDGIIEEKEINTPNTPNSPNSPSINDVDHINNIKQYVSLNKDGNKQKNIKFMVCRIITNIFLWTLFAIICFLFVPFDSNSNLSLFVSRSILVAVYVILLGHFGIECGYYFWRCSSYKLYPSDLFRMIENEVSGKKKCCISGLWMRRIKRYQSYFSIFYEWYALSALVFISSLNWNWFNYNTDNDKENNDILSYIQIGIVPSHFFIQYGLFIACIVIYYIVFILHFIFKKNVFVGFVWNYVWDVGIMYVTKTCFNILSCSYDKTKNKYILDIESSDLVCFQGIHCLLLFGAVSLSYITFWGSLYFALYIKNFHKSPPLWFLPRFNIFSTICKIFVAAISSMLSNYSLILLITLFVFNSGLLIVYFIHEPHMGFTVHINNLRVILYALCVWITVLGFLTYFIDDTTNALPWMVYFGGIPFIILFAWCINRKRAYNKLQEIDSNFQGFEFLSSKSKEELTKFQLLFDEYIKMYPKTASVLFVYGEILRLLEKDDDGIIYLRKALELNSNLLLGHANIAALLEKQGKYDEAAKHLKVVIELNSSDPISHNNYAKLLHFHFADYENAAIYYKKAIDLELERSNGSQKTQIYYANYARLLHENLNNKQEANKYYRIALQLDYKDETTRFRYATLNNMYRTSSRENPNQLFTPKQLLLDESMMYTLKGIEKDLNNDYIDAIVYYSKVIDSYKLVIEWSFDGDPWIEILNPLITAYQNRIDFVYKHENTNNEEEENNIDDNLSKTLIETTLEQAMILSNSASVIDESGDYQQAFFMYEFCGASLGMVAKFVPDLAQKLAVFAIGIVQRADQLRQILMVKKQMEQFRNRGTGGIQMMPIKNMYSNNDQKQEEEKHDTNIKKKENKQIKKNADDMGGNLMMKMLMNQPKIMQTFNYDEFSRVKDSNTRSTNLNSQITATKQDIDTVANGLREQVSKRMWTVKQIAAQWKNVNLKGSNLTPTVIEAALLHIIEHKDDAEYQDIFNKADISWSISDGSGFFAKGVCVFSFSKKETT